MNLNEMMANYGTKTLKKKDKTQNKKTKKVTIKSTPRFDDYADKDDDDKLDLVPEIMDEEDSAAVVANDETIHKYIIDDNDNIPTETAEIERTIEKQIEIAVNDDEDSEEDDDDGEIIATAATTNDAATSQHILQDEEDDDASDAEDETYLQKFQTELNKKYLANTHPECVRHNNNEVQVLSQVVRDQYKNIIDSLHRTLPYLTKYEKTRVIGQRAKQIDMGASIFIEVDSKIIDGYVIAEMELMARKIPFIIRRPIPGGGSEYWNLKDLDIL